VSALRKNHPKDLVRIGEDLTPEQLRRVHELARQIGDFIGVALDQWRREHWQQAALLAMGRAVLFEDLAAGGRHSRGRPKSAHRFEETPDHEARSRRRIHGIGHLSLEQAHELIDEADRFKTDAEFARTYAARWSPIDRAVRRKKGRQRSALRGSGRQAETATAMSPDHQTERQRMIQALQRALSRYRIEFARRRPR
jgi:hypothetical protein